ncbi:hypothetical protein L484_004496 [Morus notabilis]|uniref:Uncharacterized protein n=1 Tax=Morus notabilis TaxID=981085 RepID=W9R7N0_9ROSA|nr:hypothetical protein L484_004496 [Morus notabilis]
MDSLEMIKWKWTEVARGWHAGLVGLPKKSFKELRDIRDGCNVWTSHVLLISDSTGSLASD